MIMYIKSGGFQLPLLFMQFPYKESWLICSIAGHEISEDTYRIYTAVDFLMSNGIDAGQRWGTDH